MFAQFLAALKKVGCKVTGSYATGLQHEFSDLDLVIPIDKHSEAARRWSVLAEHLKKYMDEIPEPSIHSLSQVW